MLARKEIVAQRAGVGGQKNGRSAGAALIA